MYEIVYCHVPANCNGTDVPAAGAMLRVLVVVQDPRTELLKYDEEAKKNGGEFLGSAYRATQPEGGGMHNRTLEEEEEDFKDEQKKLLDS